MIIRLLRKIGFIKTVVSYVTKSYTQMIEKRVDQKKSTFEQVFKFRFLNFCAVQFTEYSIECTYSKELLVVDFTYINTA